MKSPRDMTQRELEALPTVNHIMAPAGLWFRDSYGRAWNVGQSGNTWVKAWRDPPPDQFPPAAAARC